MFGQLDDRDRRRRRLGANARPVRAAQRPRRVCSTSSRPSRTSRCRSRSSSTSCLPTFGRRCTRLADEVGLDARTICASRWRRSQPPTRLRVRLGRALALDPRVLLAEHPNASLPPDDVAAFAADLSRIVAGRRIASLVLTADRTFATRGRRRGAHAPAGDRRARSAAEADGGPLGCRRRSWNGTWIAFCQVV